MHFTRMIVSHEGHLTYDFMGYSEYEGGANLNGRAALAQAKINNDLIYKKVDVIECYGLSKSPPTPMVVMGRRVTLGNMGNTLKVQVDKTSLRLDNDDIVGWLHVFGAYQDWDEVKDRAFPFAMFRPDFFEKHQDKIDAYIDKFVKEMQEAT